MFNSLRARLWLSYALVVAVALSIVGFGLLIFLLRSPVGDRQTYLRLDVIADSITTRRDINLPGDLLSVQSLINRAEEVLNVRLIILAPDGKLLLDSQARTQPVIKGLEKVSSDQSTRALRDVKGQTWLLVMRMLNNGYRLLVASQRPLRTGVVLKTIGDELLTPFIQAGLIALFLALILAYGVARWVAAPLQRMAEVVCGVADGFHQHVNPEGPEEVKALGESFNEMTDRVQASRDSQRNFVANVSHELKTPLTSIQGFAQAMLDGAMDTPEANRHAAQIIFDEAGRMSRLVSDLLELARFDAGTIELIKQPLNLADLLQYIVEKLALQAQQQQVELTFEQMKPADSADTISPLPACIGDGDRLVQVFTNLIDNALKHTPPGGKVTVQARQVSAFIEISVADTGAGIPPDELPNIFERFYQVDKSRQGGQGRGVGLGLAIAREIVQAHGGTLTAQSEPAQGSLFMVKLPIETL